MPQEMDLVLAFYRVNGETMLARKTRDKIGGRCLNGFGGKVEKGQSFLEALEDECRQESGAKISRFHTQEVALLLSYNHKEDGTVVLCKVRTYLVWHYKGKVRDTEEMVDAAWYDDSDLPFDQMMLADRYCLPTILAADGRKFIVTIHYGPKQQTLLAPVVVEEVEFLPE